MSSLPVTVLPAVTAFPGLSPHARARAREGVNGESGSKPVTRGNPVTPPPPQGATILRHCRCEDCVNWRTLFGCRVLPFVPYVPRQAYPEPLRKFWSDAGMIRPGEWHYCALYQGPQISKDVLVVKHPQGGESHARD